MKILKKEDFVENVLKEDFESLGVESWIEVVQDRNR